MQSPYSRSNEVNKVKLSLSRSQIPSNPDGTPPFLQPGFEFAQYLYDMASSQSFSVNAFR